MQPQRRAVVQWAMVLHHLGVKTGAETTLYAAWIIVPIIVIAECFSWHAVLTRNFRWNAIENSLCRRLSYREGLRDVSFRWVVTHDFAEWKDEIAWMSLYFSGAVWSSLALCFWYCAYGA